MKTKTKVLDQLEPEEEYEEADSVQADGGAVAELDRLRDEVVDRYHDEMRSAWPRYETYDEIYEDVKESGVEYGADDVAAFVVGNVNQDYDRHRSEVLGLYTGVLAEVLTERNDARGESTEIYVNGGGGEFPRLFTHARRLDRLHIENFVGDNMLAFIAQQEGEIGTVIGENLEGDSIATWLGAGGTVEEIRLMDIVGDRTGDGIGEWEMSVGRVYMSGIEGEDTGWHMGGTDYLLVEGCEGRGILRELSERGREMGTAVVRDSKGKLIADHALSFEGTARNLVFDDLEGENVGWMIGDTMNGEGGEVGTIVFRDIEGDGTGMGIGSGSEQDYAVVLSGIEGDDVLKGAEGVDVVRPYREVDKRRAALRGYYAVFDLLDRIDESNDVDEKLRLVEQIDNVLGGVDGG